MSMLLIEGWDIYGAASNVVSGNWSEIGGTPVWASNSGSLAGAGVTMNSTSDFTRVNIANVENPNDFYMGVQFKTDTLQTDVIIQLLDKKDTNGLLAHLRLKSDGALEFRSDVITLPVHGTTAAGIIATGTWYTIEIRVRPSSFSASTANADGILELRVDGTERLNLTNVSIQPADTGSPRPTGIGGVQIQGSTAVFTYDDVYMFNDSGTLNNDFAGDFHIQTLRPASDTATASWTAVGAGDHYIEVDDDEPDGDTSYVSSQTSTEADIYELTNLTGDVGAILGYGPIMVARKEIGSTQNVGIRMIGSSETVNFSGHNLADDYEVRSNLRSASVDDPGQTTAPDIAEVNALQAGVVIP